MKQLDDGRWAGYMVVGADRTVVAVGGTAEAAWAKAVGSQFLFPWQMVEAGYECVPIWIEKSGPAVSPKRNGRPEPKAVQVTRLPAGQARGLEPETVGDLIYRQHSGGGPSKKRQSRK